MLTGKFVRVRYARDRVIPQYVDASDPIWLEAAGRLVDLFRAQHGNTRGSLQEDLREIFGNDPSQLVHQGLAKLLEDRCEFEVVSGHSPEKIREAVFRTATSHRAGGWEPFAPSSSDSITVSATPFSRQAVLQEVADSLGLPLESIDEGLFADLKSEQRLIRFKDITAERLLQRYNVALAQAVLLRSMRVEVEIRGESPQRYRQLCRLVKFHRLVCQIKPAGADSYRLQLDGPLSLFAATLKYGLQLALFLPAILLCKDFELRAELSWGAQRKPKSFALTSADGLVSHYADTGTYVPPEMRMFIELFRKKVTDWDIAEETSVLRLGDGFWVPDFRLTERATGRSVLMEVLGFWRRSSLDKHLERLLQHAREPFLLAISEQLRVDEAELAELPAAVYRFRQMPLPDEVARLAGQLLAATPTTHGQQPGQ